MPYLAFSHSMALGRLVEDHLANHPLLPRLRRCIDCDSAGANMSTYSEAWEWPGCLGPWCSATVRPACLRWRATAIWMCISMYVCTGPSAAAEQFWTDITGQ